MTNNYKDSNPIEYAMSRANVLLTQAVESAIESGSLPKSDVPNFAIEIPADSNNGDLACNIAMVSARSFKLKPLDIAKAICDNIAPLTGDIFEKIEIAGPGFINLFFSQNWYTAVVKTVWQLGQDYGKSNAGQGKKVNVEFVSANPTGPMHLGNARGGAMGDCLAAALDSAGYDVTREFYVNDAGNQIVKFGKSLAARYKQIYKGESEVPFPEDGYQGEDITELAGAFAKENGDKYMSIDESELENRLVKYALPKNIAALKSDLQKYRIDYDVWFSEQSLYDDGSVKDVLQKLKNTGATYEKDGAIWYKSTQYSEKYGANKNARKGADGNANEEEKDEVLVRANGIPTYFAADIAYHYNKFATRKFETCINIWGADHHGHVARIKGAMDALGLDGEKLHIVLMQFVRLLQDGQPVRMSKRTGKAITLSSLLNEVPIDSARFLFNMREAGSAVDFDLDLAVKQDSDNPVYYVQYAHARICSIIKKLNEENLGIVDVHDCDLSLLNHDSEKSLIRTISYFAQEIAFAAKNCEPARLTRYAEQLATQYHKFYNSCRVKDADEPIRKARIALCYATKICLYNVLSLIKVTIPESM